MWLSVDPLAEKYPNVSPYAYTFQNPVKYTDPTGMAPDWHEDNKGNLVADKGDNAKTLGEYLNTTTEIATKIIGASGLITNKQGNLEEGATVSLGYSTYPASIKANLGGLGNEIRNRAGSDFSKEMFTRYWNGDGDYNMGVLRFASILNYIKNNPKALETTNSITLSNGNKGKYTIANFYKSSEYALAFGRATIYSNSEGKAVGFYDTYDFDPKSFTGQGSRTLKNELITRAVNYSGAVRRMALRNGGAKPFNIRFGLQKK